ncbi:MAG: hypothetical protein HXX18_12845 [Bacteroidetes bacterium]|nr:hypothetical protein [Bacteroidota bacterium]
MKKINLFLSFIALLFITVSCNKSDDPNAPVNYEQQQTLAKNYAFIQDVYGDIFDLLCRASDDSVLMASGNANIGGAVVSYTPSTHLYTFIFPSSGSFEANLNGDFRNLGTVANITFNNYTVGGNPITGNIKITNTGVQGFKSSNTIGPIISFTDSIYNATITKGGEVINVNALFHIDWMMGDTTIITDDQYKFSGNINGVVSPYKSFSAVIQTGHEVIVNTISPYIQSGLINALMRTPNSDNNAAIETNVQIEFLSIASSYYVKITTPDGIIQVPQ